MKEVIYLRLEKSLKQKLDQLAQKDDRSLNNYIIQLLRKHVEEKEKKEEKWY